MIKYNEHGFPYEEVASIQELSYRVKITRKDFHKESQPALKRYLQKQLITLQKQLDKTKRNDSGFKMLRTSWAKCPQVKYDSLEN
jgi:hypothetical protein